MQSSRSSSVSSNASFSKRRDRHHSFGALTAALRQQQAKGANAKKESEPDEKKAVRFADAMGFDLVQVNCRVS